MARDLTDKVIIITGASSGIGAATALECARHGMHVVLNARREERLKQMTQRVNEIGVEAIYVAGGVAELGMSDRLLDAAEDRFGGFHAVFANAGFGANKPMHEVTDSEMREMFDVNFFAGANLLTKAANRLLDRKQSGHLLMCASCLARFSLPMHGHYCASKSAQCQVCWAMRGELRPYGVDVSCVFPVTTATEFFEVSAEKSGNARQPGAKPKIRPDDVPRFLVQSPQRVARAVVRCLKKPKPEVWTSTLVRLVAGAMTASPAFASFVHWTQREKRGAKASR